jgi:hypothetical protein
MGDCRRGLGNGSSAIPFAQRVKAFVNDVLVRIGGFDRVLKPEKDGAVLLKLVAIKIELLDLRCIFVYEQVERIYGLHATIFIQSDVDLSVRNLRVQRQSRYFRLSLRGVRIALSRNAAPHIMLVGV